MSTWEIEHDCTNVVCPSCAFSFDAIHQDGDGGYTCPLCESAPASGEPSGAEAVVHEALDALASLFKQALYVRERDTHGAWLPDWACAECRPDSDLIEDGFRCGFHAAKAVLSANDRLPTAPGASEEGAGE